MDTTNAIYQLDTTVPPYKAMMNNIIAFMVVMAGMMVLPAGFKIGCMIAAAFIGGSLLQEYVSKQIRHLALNHEYLEIGRGSKGKIVHIPLNDIKRVELIETHRYDESGKKYRTKKRDAVTTILIDGNNKRQYPAGTKCVIRTNSGKKYEINSAYFEEDEFGNFLSALQNAYSNRQPVMASAPPVKNMTAGHTNSLQQPPKQGEDKISQVMRTNLNYLHEDLQLKKALEANMIEAYKSLYRIRDSFDIAKMVDVRIVYTFRNPDNSDAYILENDYLPELDHESIEIGQNLIEAAQKNLTLVETRIAYYKKIDSELERIRFQEAHRRKLQGVAQNLKTLQEKNTNKSLDQSLVGSELDVEAKIIAQLEELTRRVHNLEDLEKSIMLNEHISLFKDQGDKLG